MTEPDFGIAKDKEEEENRRNEEDDEDEELSRQEQQEDEDENIYSDDMKARSFEPVNKHLPL